MISTLIFHKFQKGQTRSSLCDDDRGKWDRHPNANTILIDRADTYGLADLYQLRGRVGRWNRTAYAYFLIPKNVTLARTGAKAAECPGRSGRLWRRHENRHARS